MKLATFCVSVYTSKIVIGSNYKTNFLITELEG